MDVKKAMAAAMRTLIITLALVLFLSYSFLFIFVYLRQGSMLYFPLRNIDFTPREIGLPFEDLSFVTGDGIRIAAWYIPAERERGVVLFCHGNAGNISHRLDSIRIFHQLDLGVLIFDYRGYGRSEGHPTERGTYLDAEAAWDYLIRVRQVTPKKIVLFGRSLGSAVAAEIALRKKAGAIILESGFTSVPALGEKFFPHLPVRLISRYQYSTIEKVGRIPIPKLFIHSPDDEIVPFQHGRALFDAAAFPKEFLEIRGGHNEGFMLSEDIYTVGVNRFLDIYL